MGAGCGRSQVQYIPIEFHGRISLCVAMLRSHPRNDCLVALVAHFSCFTAYSSSRSQKLEKNPSNSSPATSTTSSTVFLPQPISRVQLTAVYLTSRYAFLILHTAISCWISLTPFRALMYRPGDRKRVCEQQLITGGGVDEINELGVVDELLDRRQIGPERSRIIRLISVGKPFFYR